MFLDCCASIPWWYSEDATEVIKNLKKHDLAQNLENKLLIKEQGEKLKI